MSFDHSIYSFEDYSDFEVDNHDDYDDQTYNFLSVFIPPLISLLDPPFLESKKLIDYLNNGTFSDVTIQVEDKKYQLHRVVLSLKSAYFLKLFARNFIEHNQKEIELKSVDVPTFDCIVKYIYENNLKSSITSENMTKLLIALDYLQIEIDQTWFFHFIQNKSEVQMADLFELFNFLVFHSAYPWLLLMLLKHFSKNLVKISQTDYFTSIPFEYFKKILLCMQVKVREEEEPKYITKICSKWICGDIANRSRYVVEIVNAVKYRYSKIFFLIDKNYDINCTEEDNKEQYMEKKLEELMNYSVEFIPAASAASFNIRNEETSVGPKNAVDIKQQMKELLNSGDLSDICIKASNKSFPAHRAILASKSTYFYNQFTTLSDGNVDEFEMEDMNEQTFGIILKYIYFEELEITPKENVVLLMKVGERFEMKELFAKIENYILEKISEIENIFELFAYLRTCTYTKLLIPIEKYILNTWSTMTEMSDFVHMSADSLQHILSLSDLFVQDESEVLKLCSKWILHDCDNRIQHIPSLISSLCRTFLTDVECQTHIEDIKNSCTEKVILSNLNKLLCSLNPVNAIKNENLLLSCQKPHFVASSGNTLHFFVCRDLQKNLEELEDLRFVIPNESINVSEAYATILDTTLFVHFNDNFFYAQDLVTKRCVSLTSDQMSNPPWRSQLLSCNDSVYLCDKDEGKILRYSTALNRWLKVPAIYPTIRRNCSQAIYASNGKNIFSVSVERKDHSFSIHKYDENTKTWKSLPDIMDLRRTYEYPKFACFFKQNLYVAFSSFSKSYNFRNKKWITISHNSMYNHRDFICIRPHQNQLILFATKKEVTAYNIHKKIWYEIPQDDSSKLTYLNTVHCIN